MSEDSAIRRQALAKALLSYTQADEEGITATVSRQALHEAADILNDEMTMALCALGVTPQDELEFIKERAMSRFNVKKSRRPHVKRILDDAFAQMLEADRATDLEGCLDG